MLYMYFWYSNFYGSIQYRKITQEDIGRNNKVTRDPNSGYRTLMVKRIL